MLEKLVYYRIVVMLAIFALLELIAIVLAPSYYSNTTLLNTVFFCVVSYLAISPLFGKAHHTAWAVIWSLLVLGLLGWFFGIIEVVLYWYLLSKKKPSSNTSRHSTSRTGTTDSSSSTTLPVSVYARVPFLRIPIPWIKYTLTEKYVTRVSWFGKDDPEPFARIENWYISGNATRAITGVSVFGFRSKKPHSDNYIVWTLMPADFAERLNQACFPKS